MKNVRSSSISKVSNSQAFTLVELLIGMSVGLLVMAAVCVIIVMSARTVTKITMLYDATSTTRKVQEHINKELSSAVSQTTPIRIVPAYSDIDSTGRAGCITYRTQIGSFAKANSTVSSSTSVTLNCPSDMNVEPGDYLMIDDPNLGTGAVVSGVSDSRSTGTAGNITLTLTTSIASATVSSVKTDIAADTLATIQRPRKYATVVRLDNPALSDLRWYESTSSSTFLVLSSNIDTSTRYLFVQAPVDPSGGYATEPSINWRISYLNGNSATYLPGSKTSYYKTNYSEGMIMPKSGNPLGTNSYAGISTSISTTSTSTTSTSTTTSTTSTTTTTSVPTTSTTSTTKTTTTKTTSTKTTSTKTTSTTSVSTTSKSTTSTSSVSTSSKSTTSKSSTTAPTTSSTKSTTSTSVSTTASTTAPTTSKSTTTSTKSTTVPTTSIPLDG